MVRQAPVICVMAPPIHLGAWSMAMAAVCIILRHAPSKVQIKEEKSGGRMRYISNN